MEISLLLCPLFFFLFQIFVLTPFKILLQLLVGLGKVGK